MNWRALGFVATVELLISLSLYALAPTDGVRVWYPSGWAYVGEHGLVWLATFAIVFWTMRKSLGMRSDALTILAGAAAELIATTYVWFGIPSSGEVSRAWYTSRFVDYFIARIESWCVLAIIATFFYLLLYLRCWRSERQAASSGNIKA